MKLPQKDEDNWGKAVNSIMRWLIVIKETNLLHWDQNDPQQTSKASESTMCHTAGGMKINFTLQKSA